MYLLIVLFAFPLYTDELQAHYVTEGENLFRISKKYNIPIKELCKINHISESTILKQGTMLKVPVKEGDTPTDDYYVKDGDNLFRIGLKYNVTVDKLCKLNNFTENVKLYTGMKLKVPAEKADQTAATPASTTANKRIPQNAAAVTAPQQKQEYTQVESYRIHMMKQGETLYQISRLYKADIKAILKLNGISESTILKPGTRIKIPQYSVSNRSYIPYELPLDGRVVPYVTSHYKGIIIFSDKNTDVSTIDSGVVSHIDSRSGYGLIVFVKHANGLVSTYSGFSEIYVKKDAKIEKGTIIGKTGKVSKYNKTGVLFSLQEGSKLLSFDMSAGKFYR